MKEYDAIEEAYKKGYEDGANYAIASLRYAITSLKEHLESQVTMFDALLEVIKEK